MKRAIIALLLLPCLLAGQPTGSDSATGDKKLVDRKIENRRRLDTDFRNIWLAKDPYVSGKDFIQVDDVNLRAELFSGPSIREKKIIAPVEAPKPIIDKVLVGNVQKYLQETVSGVVTLDPEGKARFLVGDNVFRTGQAFHVPGGDASMQVVVERVGRNGMAQCRLIQSGLPDYPFTIQVGSFLDDYL